MLVTLILLIFASLLAATYCWWKINFNYWTRYPQIPSVKGRIFSGNLKDFLTLKTNFSYQLRTIYEDEKFQNAAVVGIYGLYKPALLIREPDLIKSVLIKEFSLFRNRVCRAGKHDVFGSLNIFFARYHCWRETRLKLAPVFSNAKIRNMYPLIREVGENVGVFLSKKPDCFVGELRDLSGRYTTDVTSTTLLGAVSNSLDNPKELMSVATVKMVEWNLKRALNFLIICFAPKLNGLVRTRIFNESTEKFMRSSIRQIMAERERTGTKRNDLIDTFVKMKKEAEMKGEDLSHCMEDIVSQASILMTAAYSTNASAICFALLELAKNQQVQQKLREEVFQAFLKGAGEISYESLSKMEYLQMVINETIRMYPNLPLFERMHEYHPDKSSGFNLQPYYDYELPNEMPVYISIYAINYDSKYWPNPKNFDPERFSAANKKHLTPTTHMPYGMGSRMCLGFRLGMLNIKVALVHFLKNHFVRVCDETKIELELEPKAFVLQPKGGVYVEFVRDNLYLSKVNVPSEVQS